MQTNTILRCFTALASVIPASSSRQPPQHNILSQDQQVITNPSLNITFRPAQESDLDDIVTVMLDAFGPSEAWRYTMPNRSQYKDLEWYCSRLAAEQQWKDATEGSDTFGMVVSVAGAELGDGRDENRTERVVNFGIWHILSRDDDATQRREMQSFPFSSLLGVSRRGAYEDQPGHGQFNCTSPPEWVNMTRAEDMSRQFTAYVEKYIGEAYAEQFYLGLLATHPRYDGNGFGAMNVQWGLRYAKHVLTGLPVTLIATPAGYPLYHELGAESVKNVTAEMFEDAKEEMRKVGVESLWWEVMRWNGTISDNA